ncbi:DUF2849 domain-containing protein [Sandaracinus amylolyticus]|uniref:DUF2849 domain-containing protein n=1 Tax=Sandaracinus amylolyticus TaxID=927083 RepID=UPI001F40CCD0|nr:DUF2849 domain-containing protein [Sandaracinus amylolyticus]UJR80310.1 Hypothetical protein I5071_23540 [Sandaracinus amylolyticus]
MAEKIERTLFVITGNRLADGRVVYLRGDQTWGSDFDAAEQLDDAARRDQLVASAQREHNLVVTGIYAFDVGLTASGDRVLSARERLRAAGEVSVRRRLRVGVEA